MNTSRIEPFHLVSNPVTGCKNGCPWCYAEPIAKNMKGKHGYPEPPAHFEPTFHEKEIQAIKDHKGTGKIIFLVSMGDLFSPGVKKDWQTKIFDAVFERPDNQYMGLTKRPDLIPSFLPKAHLRNFMIGVSVTSEAYLWRWRYIQQMNAHWGGKWISFEPLRGPVIRPGSPVPDFSGLDWAIIGAQTGNINKVTPNAAWLILLTEALKDQGIPVYWKDNLWKEGVVSQSAVSAQKEMPKIRKPGQSTLGES